MILDLMHNRIIKGGQFIPWLPCPFSASDSGTGAVK